MKCVEMKCLYVYVYKCTEKISLLIDKSIEYSNRSLHLMIFEINQVFNHYSKSNETNRKSHNKALHAHTRFTLMNDHRIIDFIRMLNKKKMSLIKYHCLVFIYFCFSVFYFLFLLCRLCA